MFFPFPGTPTKPRFAPYPGTAQTSEAAEIVAAPFGGDTRKTFCQRILVHRSVTEGGRRSHSALLLSNLYLRATASRAVASQSLEVWDAVQGEKSWQT
jgi:hypothetical protein